jgi:sugar lactone lactonase YvrE
MKAEPIAKIKSILGEGPIWHENALYWVDILGKKINRYFPNTERTEEMQLDQYVSALAPRKKGGFILALQHGFYFLDKFNGILTPISDPEKDMPNNRFNDGKCDAGGNFWAGTMALDHSLNKGALYLLKKDRTVTKKYSPVTISNGICWSLDNKTMYYIDTRTQQILAFDFDLETSEIKNPRAIITINEKEGKPDGMTIDKNGNLWVALWGGSAVACFNPKNGKLIEKIKLPVSQVSSCTFGGKNLNELYITTANCAPPSGAQQLAGRLFRVKMKIKGLPVNYFAG